MPVYEYECLCNDCGKVFEYFAKSTKDVCVECQLCGGPVRRVMSTVNANFSAWVESRNAQIAYALSDDDYHVDPKKLPKKPFREV